MPVVDRDLYIGILVWTLCNEMYMGTTFKKNGVTFGAERFHAVKQTLDPARLMNDQDGACGAGDVRDSLSFCSLGFDVFNFGCIAIDTGSYTCSKGIHTLACSHALTMYCRPPPLLISWGEELHPHNALRDLSAVHCRTHAFCTHTFFRATRIGPADPLTHTFIVRTPPAPAGDCIAGEVPTKYHGHCNPKTGDCPGAVPALPIISHETGNYVRPFACTPRRAPRPVPAPRQHSVGHAPSFISLACAHLCGTRSRVPIGLSRIPTHGSYR